MLLSPTRSLVRAKRSLSACRAAAARRWRPDSSARRLVDEEVRRGATPVVVVLTDGQPTSPATARLAAHRRPDALAAARVWPALGIGALWLDTAPQPQESARRLAEAMGARYLPLPTPTRVSSSWRCWLASA